jgi:hypothetical protein
LDSLSGEITTNAATSSVVMFGTTSLRFTNGHLQLGLTEDLPITWKFQCWVKLDANKTFPLLSLDAALLFSLVLDETLNTITLLYSPLPGDVVTISKPMQLTTDWMFITVIRKANIVTVYSDLTQVAEFTDVFYPANTGDLYFGKDLISTNNFYGNAQSLLLDLNFNINSPFLENIDVYKKYYMPTTSAVNSHSIVLGSDVDYSEGTGIYPAKGLFTYFDYSENCYVVTPSTTGTNHYDNPRGLVIVKEEEAEHPDEFLLDIEFELFNPNGILTNCVICTGYNNFYNNGFYIVYDAGELKFIYYVEGSTTKYTEVIGDYTPGTTVKVVLERTDTYFKVHYNGVLVINSTVALSSPLALLYKFNYNAQSILNTNTFVKLRKFKIVDLVGTYAVSDDSYVLGGSVFYKSYTSQAFRLHQIQDRINTKKAFIPFTVSTDTIQPGQSKTLTVTQVEYGSPVLYSVKVKIPKFSDLLTTDVICTNNFTINNGTLTFALSVSLSTFTKEKKVSYFDIEISNGTFSATSRMVINNVPALPDSVFKLSGYVEGILASNNLEGFDTVDGTTSVSKLNTSLYGDIYRIAAPSEKITLSSPLTGVRTMFLAYQELTSRTNRVYFGNANTYTFNGGTTGELVGPLVVSGSDFLLVRDSEDLIRRMAISSNDAVIVRANEGLDTIEVLRKVNNIWNATTPITTLNLQLQTPSSVSNCTIDITPDGNKIVLGFPDANNGEGVVQVWEYTTSWTKTLHLGSPIPIPNNLGGFGSQVVITPDGTTIAVAEIGSEQVFLFNKTTTWNNVPFQTITNTEVATNLSITDTDLAVSYANDSIRLYTKASSTSWTLNTTLSGYSRCVLDKLSNKFLLSKVFTGDVVLRALTATTTNIKTFSGTALSYGFDIAILDSIVTISNPSSSEVYQYSPSGYTTPITVTSTKDDYGFYITTSSSSIVVSNYEDTMTIHTSNSSGYGERIENVYVDGVLTPKNTKLDVDNVKIYAFTTVVPMTITEIGSGYNTSYGANSINGLFLGALFYNRVLTNAEIASISGKLKRRLNIQELKLSE